MSEVTAEQELAVAVVGVQDPAHDCLQGLSPANLAFRLAGDMWNYQ